MRIRSIVYTLGMGLLPLLLAGAAKLFAGELEINPSITLREVYSDNINLQNSGEESDYVTEISPELVITGKGNRLRFAVNYAMQNLLYVEESDRNTTNHNLNAGANAVVIDEHLFLDLSATSSQQLRDIKNGASADAISGSRNLDDVYSYSASPYWKQRVGDITEFNLRYTYDVVESQAENRNSDRNAILFSIISGPDFSRVFWNGNYQKSEIDYEDDAKSDTELAQGKIGYHLFQTLSVHISGLYEDNTFEGNRGRNNPEDSYWGGGFTWAPSHNFDVTAVYNERTDPRPFEDEHFWSGELNWKPSVRTNIKAAYGNRFFGETYRFNFNHRTRRTSWAVNYDESISSFRQQVIDPNSIGSLVCPLAFGDFSECRSFDPNQPPEIDEQLIGSVDILPSINENAFISKRFNMSFTLRGNRNTIILGAINQRREFVVDEVDERDIAVYLNWKFDVAPRMVSDFRLRRTDREFDDSREAEINDVTWRLTRRLTAKATCSLAFEFSDRDASSGGGQEYTENRVTLSYSQYF